MYIYVFNDPPFLKYVQVWKKGKHTFLAGLLFVYTCITLSIVLFKNYLCTVLLTRLSNLLECIVKRLGG